MPVNSIESIIEAQVEARSETESVGSHSDASGRARMDVVCMLDLQNMEHMLHRKTAYECVRQACGLVNAAFQHIQVFKKSQKLIFLIIK
jgi:hypothetical protein